MDKLENENSNWDSFITMKRWLENRNEGKSFADYFHQYGIHKIAIYGAGDLGKLLYTEIKETDISIEYFVDRNGEGIQQMDGIPVITLSDIGNMREVDILVITPLANYSTICETLMAVNPKLRTVSLKEAVYEF